MRGDRPVEFRSEERWSLTVKRPEGEPGAEARHLGNPGLCAVFWGSHGCEKSRGHRWGHRCSCCHCGWFHGLLHRHRGCVGRAPYYGPDTTFYGRDAAR